MDACAGARHGAANTAPARPRVQKGVSRRDSVREGRDFMKQLRGQLDNGRATVGGADVAARLQGALSRLDGDSVACAARCMRSPPGRCGDSRGSDREETAAADRDSWRSPPCHERPPRGARPRPLGERNTAHRGGWADGLDKEQRRQVTCPRANELARLPARPSSPTSFTVMILGKLDLAFLIAATVFTLSKNAQ